MRRIPLATMAWLPAALFSTAVLAQPAPATGTAGKAATDTSTPAPAPAPAPAPPAGGPAMAPGGPGTGGGMGAGPGMGRNPRRGPALMTPAEREEYQGRMRSMKTYSECVAYQKEHRKLLEQRAKERGAALPPQRMNPCDQMRSRGLLK